MVVDRKTRGEPSGVFGGGKWCLEVKMVEVFGTLKFELVIDCIWRGFNIGSAHLRYSPCVHQFYATPEIVSFVDLSVRKGEGPRVILKYEVGKFDKTK